MLFPKFVGQIYIYEYEDIKDFTDVSSGTIIKSIFNSMRVLYIDFENSSQNMINLFENLSLNRNFSKNFRNLRIDFLSNKKNGIFTQSIIPLVEYSQIRKEDIFTITKEYDVVILENLNSQIEIEKVLEFLKNKKEDLIVLITTKIKNLITKNFDAKFLVKTNSNLSLYSKKNIEINNCFDEENTIIFTYGKILRKIISKENFNFLICAKNKNLFEIAFFSFLKKFIKDSNIYNSFDFAIFVFDTIQNQSSIIETIVKKKEDLIISNFENLEKFENNFENSNSKIEFFSSEKNDKIENISFKINNVVRNN